MAEIVAQGQTSPQNGVNTTANGANTTANGQTRRSAPTMHTSLPNMHRHVVNGRCLQRPYTVTAVATIAALRGKNITAKRGKHAGLPLQ